MTEQPIATDIYAEAFFTADHAAVENGKLYVNGGAWNRTAHPSFPTGLTFAVAAVLHIPWRAHRQSHGFAIWFEDADGQTVGGQIAGRFQATLGPDARADDASIAPLAVNISGFVFQRPGDYSAVLAVDGAEVSRWHFRVVQTFGMPAGPLELGGNPPPANLPAE